MTSLLKGDDCCRCAFLLQLNLKFEIEVLCKNLSLDINELKPGNLLKDKDKLKNLEEQLSAPKKESKAPEETLAVSTAGGPPAVPLRSGLFRALLQFSCPVLHTRWERVKTTTSVI